MYLIHSFCHNDVPDSSSGATGNDAEACVRPVGTNKGHHIHNYIHILYHNYIEKGALYMKRALSFGADTYVWKS